MNESINQSVTENQPKQMNLGSCHLRLFQVPCSVLLYIHTCGVRPVPSCLLQMCLVSRCESISKAFVTLVLHNTQNLPGFLLAKSCTTKDTRARTASWGILGDEAQTLACVKARQRSACSFFSFAHLTHSLIM